jgi:hypothetical protein
VVVVITEWALDAYLDLLHAGVFSKVEYRRVIRPDVELLASWPSHPRFASSKFWSVATDKAGRPIPGAWKMKWHNLGPGKVQLRLGVVIAGPQAVLCRAWVKDSDATDKRELAKLKTHVNRIHSGQYVVRGTL